MGKISEWDLGSVQAHVVCGQSLTEALREAANWIAEAYEGDEPIYSVLGITLYEDDESYSVTIFVE